MSIFGGTDEDHTSQSLAEDDESDYEPPSFQAGQQTTLQSEGAESDNGSHRAGAAEDTEATDGDATDYLEDEQFHLDISKVRKWRHHTVAERRLHDSLINSQADELQIHLYNTYALHAQARASSGSDRVPIPRRFPPTVWTTWPLEPEFIPAPKETFNEAATKHSAGIADTDDWIPSMELQDELVATFQRQAAASWQGQANAATAHGQAATALGDASLEHMPIMLADDGEATTILQPRVQRIMADLASLLRSAYRDHLKADEPRAPWADEEIEYLMEGVKRHGKGRWRRILNDPDFAFNGRTARALASRYRLSRRLSKRQAREGSIELRSELESEYDCSRSSSPIESVEHAVGARERGRKKSRTAGHRNGRSTSISGRSSAADEPDIPMDWSQLMNLAGQIGWDAEALKRATARCKALFGEPRSSLWRIRDRQSQEPPLIKSTAVGRVPATTDRAGDSQYDEASSPPRGWELSRLSCPYQNCQQYEHIFAAERSFIKHMRTKHGYDPRPLLQKPKKRGRGPDRRPRSRSKRPKTEEPELGNTTVG